MLLCLQVTYSADPVEEFDATEGSESSISKETSEVVDGILFRNYHRFSAKTIDEDESDQVSDGRSEHDTENEEDELDSEQDTEEGSDESEVSDEESEEEIEIEGKLADSQFILVRSLETCYSVLRLLCSKLR